MGVVRRKGSQSVLCVVYKNIIFTVLRFVQIFASVWDGLCIGISMTWLD